MAPRAAALLLAACPAAGWKHFGADNVDQVDWRVVPPEALSDIPDDVVKVLTRCARLTAAQVAAVRPAAWASVTPQCVKSLAPAAFAGVTSEQARHFGAAVVSAMSARQTAALRAASCAGFGDSDGFAHLPPGACHGITRECVEQVAPASHVHLTRRCLLPLQQTTEVGRTTRRLHAREVQRAAAEAERRAKGGDGGGGMWLAAALLAVVGAAGWNVVQARPRRGAEGAAGAGPRAPLCAGAAAVRRYDGGGGEDGYSGL